MDVSVMDPTRSAGRMRAVVSVFWVLVADAVLVLGLIFFRFLLPDNWNWIALVWMGGGVLLFSLGLVLLILVVSARLRGTLQLTLLLTACGTVGFPLFAVLHNVIYGLFKGYFDRSGGDEAFMFILALLVCPVLLLAGVIGTMLMLSRGAHKQYL